MTITLTRKEAQQVLDALNAVWKMDRSTIHDKAIEILRARLSAPESKPVAWNIKHNRPPLSSDNPHEVVAVIKREWQWLTDEEAAELCHAPIAAIEAKLREKNHD